MYTTIKTTELAQVRWDILNMQNGRCALCGCVLTPETGIYVDHQHCFKAEELGDQGAGLIRGALCRNCNALEGKIWNALHRYQAVDNQDIIGSRIRFLQSLIHYYQHNYQHVNPTLHPYERRAPKMTKSEYNALYKWFIAQESNYTRSRKLKKFPPFKGKITPSIAKIMIARAAQELKKHKIQDPEFVDLGFNEPSEPVNSVNSAI